MTTRFSRLLPAALITLGLLLPLSAMAQQVEALPNAQATVVAGGSVSAGVGYLNDTGADQTDVVITLTTPGFATWNTVGCTNSGFDLTNINTTGEITIASVLADTSVGLLCPLEVAASTADGEVFQVAASTQGVGDTSSEITVAREFDLGLAVVDAPDPVVAGSGAGNLTHTFTLSRSGPSDADLVAVLLEPVLPDGVTPVDLVPTVGDIQTIGDDLFWVVGDWPASENGNDQTLVITLTVDATAAVCDQCVQATGTVAANNGTDTNPANDSAVNPTSISREFDLGLAVEDMPDPVLAGANVPGNLTHSFTLSRSGPSDADGVAVAIVPTLPTGVTPVSFVPTVGTFDTNTLTWNVGDWAASENGNDQELVITLTVDATATACTDCISAEGTVSATSGTDTDGTNDSAVNPTSVEEASDQTSTFATSVVFTNGFEGTVTATLTCTAGLPLEQDFDISEDSPVTFTMSDLPFTTPGTTCEITATGVDGYAIEASANGGTADDSCMYDSTTFDPSGANSCVFTATPNLSEFAVDIDFDGIDDPAIDLGWELEVVCEPAADAEDATVFPGVTWNVSGSGSYMNTFTFFAEPEDGSDCTATLDGLSTAIEQDGPCTIEEIAVGEVDDPDTDDSETPTCTITATAFYEGIPTLSQYGLAIMALLMLGMGFIGFRRFV
jgi:hypothetical protein